MSIVGFNIDGLSGEKKPEAAQGNLQVNYAPKIESVESATVRSFDDEVAKIDFTFTVSYDVGDTTGAEIELEGNILWKGDVDEVVESWEENEELPENVEKPLMNDLYRTCISQAVGIADTLKLLPPIPTPRIE